MSPTLTDCPDCGAAVNYIVNGRRCPHCGGEVPDPFWSPLS